MCDRFTIRPNLNECRYRATLEISKVAKWERDHTHRLVLDAARGNVDPQEVPILLDVKAKSPPQPPPSPPPPPPPSPSPSPKPKSKKLFLFLIFFLKFFYHLLSAPSPSPAPEAGGEGDEEEEGVQVSHFPYT